MSFRHNQFGNIPQSVPPVGIENRQNVGPVSKEKNLVETFENYAGKVEEYMDTVASGDGPIPINFKSYIPVIGRILIVATFLEDSMRIFSQWTDQVYYLWVFRHIPRFLVVIFLSINLILMFSGSVLIIARKKIEYAAGALLFVVIGQGFVYGLIFDFQFFLRNLSVIGGLVLVASDSVVRDKRSLSMPGLPMLDSKDNRKYFLLVGRVLLILMFLGFLFNKHWGFAKFLVSLFAFVGCAAIVVGYKTKFSALVLVILLLIFNISANHYWSFPNSNPNRDFRKYEFFQTLSIVGGLLIIVTSGAGEISLDEKKKVY